MGVHRENFPVRRAWTDKKKKKGLQSSFFFFLGEFSQEAAL